MAAAKIIPYGLPSDEWLSMVWENTIKYGLTSPPQGLRNNVWKLWTTPVCPLVKRNSAWKDRDMKIVATENRRSRHEELGQFLTAAPVADFMASMFGPLPIPIFLLRKWAPSSIYSPLRDQVVGAINE